MSFVDIHTAAVVNQVEFYFGPLNLPRDIHLNNLMDAEGWVALAEVCQWPRMALLGAINPFEVAKALDSCSTTLEVHPSMQFVRLRRTAPLSVPPLYMPHPHFHPHAPHQAYPVLPPHLHQVPAPHMHPHPGTQPQPLPLQDQVGAIVVPPRSVPPPPPQSMAIPPFCMGLPTAQPLCSYQMDTQPQMATPADAIQTGMSYAPVMPMPPVPMMPPMPQPKHTMQATPHQMTQSAQVQGVYEEEKIVVPQEKKHHLQAGVQQLVTPMETMALTASGTPTEASDPNSSVSQEFEDVPAQNDVQPPVQPMAYSEPGPVHAAQVFGMPASLPSPLVPMGYVMGNQFPPMPVPLPHAVGHAGVQVVGAHPPHQLAYRCEAVIDGELPQHVLVPTPSQVSTNGSDTKVAICGGASPQPPAQNGCGHENQAVYRGRGREAIERVGSEVSSNETEALHHRANRSGSAEARGSPMESHARREPRRRGGDGPNDKCPRQERYGAGWKKPYSRFHRSGGNDAGSSGGKRKSFHRMHQKDRHQNTGRRGQMERADDRRERLSLRADNFPPLPLASCSAPGSPRRKADGTPGAAVSPAGAVWANKPISVLRLNPSRPFRSPPAECPRAISA